MNVHLRNRGNLIRNWTRLAAGRSMGSDAMAAFEQQYHASTARCTAALTMALEYETTFSPGEE